MEKIKSLMDEIVKRFDALQNIEKNSFVSAPDITDEKLNAFENKLDQLFRDVFPIVEIPLWAKKCQGDLIGWYDVAAEGNSELINSIVTESNYKTLYLSKNAKPLSEFTKDLIHDHIFLTRLRLIASLLTEMAQSELYIIRIRPEWFIFHKDRIDCHWNMIEKNQVNQGQTMIDKYELGWMHPALRKREIPKDFSLISAVNHTFAYLILYTLTRLPPPRTIGDFRLQLDRFRAYNPGLSPFLRSFFLKWLSSDLAGIELKTPLDCWQEFETILAEIDERNNMICKKGDIECKAESAFGRNKRNNDNEDSTLFLKDLPSNYAFAGIADGVSTATLGSGWLASATIKKSFQIFQSQWRDTILSFPSPLVEPLEWEKAAIDFLNHVFETVHRAVAEEINHFASIKKNTDDEKCDSTMSSTLVLALIAENCVVTGHWGDSRAYLLCDRGMVRLTEDHNNQLNSMVQSRKSGKPFRMHQEGASRLTRTVGACMPSSEKKGYSAIPLEKQPVAINTVSLKNKEFLLLCSDGLLSGLSVDSEKEKEDKIESVFQDFRKKGCRKIAHHLVRASDDDRGDDNISVMVLQYNS